MTLALDITTLRSVIRARGVPAIRANGQTIKIETASCRFGGERYYLVCPSCDRRAIRLYASRQATLGCRRCAVGRDYLASRNLTRDERLRRKRAKLAARLGGTDPYSFVIPPRPARMWRRTYDKLWSAIAHIDNARLAILKAKAIAMGILREGDPPPLHCKDM
jgi:hypothetical protein